ncbi:tetratricopeptide repeat protein [Luminiphilus sp.]|nr:tetratricopeptide repeat protein [Luminiphilus sp.]
MALTLDQALKRGVAAHKEGKLQDAEQLYRAILQAQPNHPDANHNLGVLAVAVGKLLQALPLFQLALDANPKIEQFWLSYIGSLITLERFGEAKRALTDGRKSGVSSDKFDALEELLQGSVPNDASKTAKSQTLKDKRKKLAERKKSKKRKAQDDSSSESPSQDQINHLLGYYQAGRLEEAETLATSLTQQFPKHPFGWKVLGIVLQQMGRLAESLAPMQSAVTLSPQDAEAQSNLGNTLRELGKLDEAEASCRQAIALKPSYAEAHVNLGSTLRELGRSHEAETSFRQAIALQPELAGAHSNLGAILQELGRFDDSEASLRQAIALKPDHAKAHGNLGITLRELGRLDEAVASYAQAIALEPDFTDAYVHLSLAIQNVRFKISAPDLYPVLVRLLTSGNFTRPSSVAGAILSLLKHDPVVENLLVETLDTISIAKATLIIESLHELPLLHHLMRLCPLPDLQFEGFFLTMRRFILSNLDRIEASPELIYFLSTLSIHCFVNEYVYYESEEEICLVGELEGAIKQAAERSLQPGAIMILCLASYRPLHQYDACQYLEALNNLDDVKKRLIEEPLAEKLIAEKTPVLGEISDGISRRVRKQYEENPYPRWVKIEIPLKAKSISEVLADLNLNLYSEHIKKITAPAILIAGCGTGQHSISTASRFANCQVTAVDLSLASLAYAQRQTNALGLTNLEYFQADILHLGQLDKEFDIIESAGVLHHMEEPMAGWTVLTDMLKPGGLMMIGLYSESARHHIVRVREEIASLRVRTSESDIREFRGLLAESHNEDHQLLTKWPDFFSLSELRDLIFHAQEHRFTLLKIQKSLDELGLKFCGFENTDIVKKFQNVFGKEADACDLSLWHQFEEENPRTFTGMYQFWCQKI